MCWSVVMSQEPSRRTFLRFGSALAAAGGLLLPFSGGGAIALPDIGEAANLRVSQGPLPVSADLLECRRLLEECAAPDLFVRPSLSDRENERRKQRYRTLRGDYNLSAYRILSRQVRTWSDCAEVAEIAWERAPKELTVDDAFT